MAKQYIDVLIDGKVYSLGGSETEGYVQQICLLYTSDAADD